MKIISGTLKGRTVKGYKIEGTRPTMDRVKESLFATIQNYINGSVVLDLFSGSGNLGFEAISNGSKTCYFNDNNKIATKTIKENAITFNITDKIHVLNFDYKKALKTLANDKVKFDIIFLDPPYKKECLNEVIDFVINNNLLNEQGLIVCEVNSLYLNNYDDYFEIIKSKIYGDKYIIIYKSIN